MGDNKWEVTERRRWGRRDVSIEAKMQILSRSATPQISRMEEVLVTNISMMGVCIRSPSISIDDLHVVGALSEESWMPNLVNLEFTLPTSPPRRVRFMGTVEWYHRIGKGAHYSMGVSIDIISPEDKRRLEQFLEED